MKDFSFFHLKNLSLGPKIRKKRMTSFCNSDASTSTLNQQNGDNPCFFPTSPVPPEETEQPQTLEEMILQLEIEEQEEIIAATRRRRSNLGRMSCVENSDILRSARNALNQYPRFSLDGKDVMYRSSFRNPDRGRKSVCCDHGIRERVEYNNLKRGGGGVSILRGESVVWCKPGVVAKLMGLESIPVPIRKSRGTVMDSFLKRENARMRGERLMDSFLKRENARMRGERLDRRKKIGNKNGSFCVMKPVAEAEPAGPGVYGGGGWPTRGFRY